MSCLYFPQSNEYDTARRTGTWMLDPISFGRPSAIASVKSAEEILAVVKFSIATGVRIVAACGRHTHESIVQESLCVDLSTHMDFVEADTVTKQVRVGENAKNGLRLVSYHLYYRGWCHNRKSRFGLCKF